MRALKRLKTEDMNTQIENQANTGNIGIKFWRPHESLRLIVALISILSSFAQFADSLKFTSVHIPSLVQRNTNFWLSCQFDLNDDDDQLYSVKWYKNNVEFYRFQPSELTLVSSASTTRSPAYLANNNGANNNIADQQQYFGQAGISIMMGSSNATHVRLLNATLESEGLYACEISTQNLSTIRSEREIRVYVLPRSRLSIVGLKNRYSIGDQVDLVCSTDFSRPKPALSWFINGRRITDESSKWFSLELKQFLSSLGNKANGDPAGSSSSSLVKLNLKLKFKLTLELLANFLSSASYTSSSQTSDIGGAELKQIGAIATATVSQPSNNGNNNNNNQEQQQLRNQSQSKQRKQLLAVDKLSDSNQQLYQLDERLMFKLKFQCKYKLTEVSDVTFNELLARQVATSPLSAALSLISEPQRPAFSGNRKLADNRQARGKRLILAAAAAAAGHTTLTKSADNQVTQSRCPANRSDIVQALKLLARNGEAGGCERGLHELHYDDPLIVYSDNSNSTSKLAHSAQVEPVAADSDEESNNGGEIDDNDEPSRNRRDLAEEGANEYSIDETISINCSTIGALLASGNSRVLVRRIPNDDNDDDLREEWKSGLARTQVQQTGYCGDPLARRRSLISGKYYTQAAVYEEFGASITTAAAALGVTNKTREDSLSAHLAGMKSPGKNRQHHHHHQQQQQQTASHSTSRQQVAYLSLTAEQRWSLKGDPTALPGSPSSLFEQQQQQQQQQQQLRRTLANTKGAAKLAAGPLISADSPDLGALENSIQVPPALLEWFINNQEALNTANNRDHQLLPQAARITDDERDYNGADSSLGASSSSPPSAAPIVELLPPIDYAQYFANFDGTPTQRHLALKLRLNKRHFMTPDSKLRLRCSSTQAQLLWMDSAQVSIVAVVDEPLGWHKTAKHNLITPKTANNYYQARAKAFANERTGNGAAAGGRSSSKMLPIILILAPLLIIL